jgi:hypothetical protein
MRALGQVGDLDIDFASTDRPRLVTTLLARCGERGEPSYWWSRPVGERIAALLRLVALTEERDELPLSARCTVPKCAELFEFMLPLRGLTEHDIDDSPLTATLEGGALVSVRRPTGEDLLRWREARPGSREQAIQWMLDTLVVSGECTIEDEVAVTAALTEGDPLVDFAVACHCPACGVAIDVAIDLEELALRRLTAQQRALQQQVHRMASHYGWTEAEVLAVPPSRRVRYLAFIEAER